MTALAPPALQSSNALLGMRIDSMTPDEAIHRIVDAAARRQAGYCCVANVHMCVLAHDDPAFRTVVNAAFLVVPDSTILQRARALRHGGPPTKSLRGAELMLQLCHAARARCLPIALVGGRDDAVLAQLKDRLYAAIPGIDISYAVSPPFGPLDPTAERAMVAAIAGSGAQLVFVGLGCPKQERWMARHSGKLDAMLVGVGAAFDFNAGVVKLSPPWVHRAGLEWLYRLCREPRRLAGRYLSTSPRFIWLLARDLWRFRRLAYPRSPAAR